MQRDHKWLVAGVGLLASVLVSGSLGSFGALAGGSEPHVTYVRTIRPAASSVYRSYDEMVARADAIFVGRPETDLAGGQAKLKYFPNSQQIETFQTLRGIKVARVIKNNGVIDLKSGKTLVISEQAMLANQGGQVVRLIAQDYEELINHNKYLFFVYRTDDDRVILFNGRFSKISLEQKEVDEDASKTDMKRKAIQQFGSQL